jgi:MFS family permease
MDASRKNSKKATEGMILHTFRAFKYRDFRVLWCGAFTSTTGNFMQQVALSWLVLELTGKSFYLGLTSFLAQIPLVLFSLVGGALADRIDRRKLLIFSQFIQMTTAFCLALLVLLGWIQVWHILALVFAAGLGQAFGGPAYHALIPTLVRREDMPNAIALNSIQFNLARVAGPMLASIVIYTAGAVACFFLNGVSFLAVIFSLLLIRSAFRPQKTDASVVSQIGEGLRFVAARRSLKQLMVLGFASTFCGVPILTLLPVFVKKIYGMDELVYAWMMSVAGGGAVVGALLYAGLSSLKNRGQLTLWSQVALAVFMGAFSLTNNLVLGSALLFATGTCLIILFASITSLVQLAVTDEMRGRVVSIFFLSFRGGMPLGDLLAGTMADTLSPATAIGFMAILLATVSMAFLTMGKTVQEL